MWLRQDHRAQAGLEFTRPHCFPGSLQTYSNSPSPNLLNARTVSKWAPQVKVSLTYLLRKQHPSDKKTQRNVFRGHILYFSCCDPMPKDKSYLRKQWFALAHRSKVQSTIEGQSKVQCELCIYRKESMLSWFSPFPGVWD